VTADEVIARAAGTLLARGVASAEVLRTVERLQALARRGRSVVVELHGLRVALPGRSDCRPQALRRPCGLEVLRRN